MSEFNRKVLRFVRDDKMVIDMDFHGIHTDVYRNIEMELPLKSMSIDEFFKNISACKIINDGTKELVTIESLKNSFTSPAWRKSLTKKDNLFYKLLTSLVFNETKKL